MKNIIALTLILISMNITNASTLKFESTKGQVSYIAKGRPAFITIKGTGNGVTGSLDEDKNILNGELFFDLTTLNSGIDLRDEHLKNNYLEVDKYPKASLKITNLKLPELSSDDQIFEGVLNLHGVDQKIKGIYALKKSSQIDSFQAEFKVNLISFKINIPSFQSITVAEEVLIKVNLPISKIE